MNNTMITNASINSIEVMERAFKFSELISQADIIPSQYRGKPANVFIAVQSAFRMNLDPMLIMQNTFIMNGEPKMKSTFAISLANQSGLFDSGIRYRVEGEGNELRVTAYTNVKKNNGEISFTIGMKEAIAENWIKNPKYRTLPELMLRYRAATLLIRTHAPEVLNGMQMVEEYEDIVASKSVMPAESKTQSISNKLDNLLPQEDNTFHAEIHTDINGIMVTIDKQSELQKLIENNCIPQELVSKWCSKAGVETINELDDSKLQSCIDYIVQRSDNNAEHLIQGE